MAVIEATVRLLPGVLGDAASPEEESFSTWEPLSVEASGSAGRRAAKEPRIPPETQLNAGPPLPLPREDPLLARAAEPLPLDESETGLEYPQYTRPRVFRDMEVPAVLLSGDHQAIRTWRRKEARDRTARTRPDLLHRRSNDPSGRSKGTARTGEPREPDPPSGGTNPTPPSGGAT
ncbi:MAG: hypothetical protein JNM84_10520 [Planctomycetes bacterium]|nr:hypothetical protein [Planctomycetota bacterium]